MNWKNIIENAINQIITVGGMIVFCMFVLVPIVKESIRTETTKIENNIDSKITNKFKKIDDLNARLDTSFPFDNTLSNSNKNCGQGFICIDIKDLTSRQKKRYNIK